MMTEREAAVSYIFMEKNKKKLGCHICFLYKKKYKTFLKYKYCMECHAVYQWIALNVDGRAQCSCPTLQITVTLNDMTLSLCCID